MPIDWEKIQFSFILVTCALCKLFVVSNGSVNILSTYKSIFLLKLDYAADSSCGS